jgi:hypothetical protein
MSGTGHSITHVFDAARWTALHRATVSARPDALFSDPLAERLAGEHGRAIVAKVPRTTRNGWWLVARTKIIDDAIAEAITNGCDAPARPAASDGSASSGQQTVECGRPTRPLSRTVLRAPLQKGTAVQEC